eukprot:gnl/Dysnectes_brevis/605_a669_2325.p1 GENE.gnl/Dysnectes_brevis/605_a669_2325~~gnl/Dysnectes_brevis/605_a669_2325.p1  ORF type:complete len:993 (+),score=430.66 gnl/Dysnectes_brevis/605_a669_2325:819-3797(+)
MACSLPIKDQEISSFICTEVTPSVVEELGCFVSFWTHKVTKTRVIKFHVSTPEKVFAVGFPTPPTDKTGVCHITEHSVLCGSKQFRTKEPFANLLQGSLQTFLNAMTYSDHTIYPTASRSEQDYINLTRVYLDAVFQPAMLTEPRILKQEGWHYHLEEPEQPVTIQGVVYSEMRGVFSDPHSVLSDEVERRLFPDTRLANSSGGIPKYIPDLDFDSFVAYHNRYYHPTNALVLFYSDLPVEQELGLLEREHLARYPSPDDTVLEASRIARQPAFPAPAPLARVPYSVQEGADTESKYWLSRSWVVADLTDPVECLAILVLDYILNDTPASPLRRHVQSGGIAPSYYSMLDLDLPQPTLTLIGQDTAGGKWEEFQRGITEVLGGLVNDGIPRKLLDSAINHVQFGQMEPRKVPGLSAIFKTVRAAIRGLPPLSHVTIGGQFDVLRAKIEEGYFERLIQEKLLDNPHRVDLVLEPVPGLQARRDAELAAKLAEYKSGLSESAILELVQATKDLKTFQTREDTPEEVATIPKLGLEHVPATPDLVSVEEHTIDGVNLVHVDTGTIPGLVYFRVLYPIRLAEDPTTLSAASFIATLLRKVDTAKRTFQDLSAAIDADLGGLSVSMAVTSPRDGPSDHLRVALAVKGKCLLSKLPEALALAAEVALESGPGIQKRERVAEILQESITDLQAALLGHSAHLVPLLAASSCVDPLSRANSFMASVEFLSFLTGLTKDADHTHALLGSTYTAITSARPTVVLGVHASEFEEARAMLQKALPTVVGRSTEEVPMDFAPAPFPPAPSPAPSFAGPGAINYAATAVDYSSAGSYDGRVRLASRLASTDYLWNNVRVQGGAYGCFLRLKPSGTASIVSYRDPHLTRTLDVYRGLGDYMRERAQHISEEELFKFKVGALSDGQLRLSPSGMFGVGIARWFSAVSDEVIINSHRELLETTPADLGGVVADIFDMLANSSIRSAFGPGEVLETAQKEGLEGEIITLK